MTERRCLEKAVRRKVSTPQLPSFGRRAMYPQQRVSRETEMEIPKEQTPAAPDKHSQRHRYNFNWFAVFMPEEDELDATETETTEEEKSHETR